ncbi:MAG: c-type cytochrome domain-containing protein [Myxococcota bacterium]
MRLCWLAIPVVMAGCDIPFGTTTTKETPTTGETVVDTGTDPGTTTTPSTETDADTDTDADADADTDVDTAVDTTTVDTGPPPLVWADVQPIFANGCAGCHYQVANGLGGFRFADETDLVNVPSVVVPGLPYVRPGDPDGSYLWHKINGTQGSVGGAGGRMPPGGALSQAQLDLVETWIRDGAL